MRVTPFVFLKHLSLSYRYTLDMEQTDVITLLALISHVMCYANSAINPLIYNFMSGKYHTFSILTTDIYLTKYYMNNYFACPFVCPDYDQRSYSTVSILNLHRCAMQPH